MPDVDNLSMALGGGARAHTRLELADPTPIATLRGEAMAHMAIALRLITLAFGPAFIRNRRFESVFLQQGVSNEPGPWRPWSPSRAELDGQ
jgi:hypothetical protein